MTRIPSRTAACLSLLFSAGLAPTQGPPTNEAPAKETGTGLGERLRSMNAWTRGVAGREAGQMGPAAAAFVPALTDMVLSSPRAEAAEALGAIGPDAASAVPAILEALEDPSSGSRYTLVEALGRIGPAARQAVGTLTVLLRDHDQRVAAEAAAALGRIEGRIAPLIERLESPRAGIRSETAELLSKVGQTAVPLLTAALASPRAIVREGAIVALGGIKPTPDSAPVTVCRLVADRNPRIRAAAAASLGKMGPAAVGCLGPLIVAMKKADCDRQDVGAAFCLGADCPTLDHEAAFCLSAVPAMESMATTQASVAVLDGARKDANLVVAASASSALAKSDPSAIPALAEALADPRLDVALAAADGLAPGRLGDRVVDLVPALEALAVRTAKDGERDEQEASCRVVAQAIARIGGPHATDSLTRLTASGCSRAAIVHHLGSSGHGGLTEPLQESPKARAAEILTQLWKAGDSYDRRRLLEQLAALGEEAGDATPYLVELVEGVRFDDDYQPGASQAREVGCAAVRVLAKTGPAGVRVALATLDRAAPEQRRSVVTAMWGMGPGAELAVPRLLELGRASFGDEYRDALAYAGARAIPGLVQALSQPENAPLAIAALSHMNPRSTPVAALTQVVDAGSDAAAAGAARALGEIGPDAAFCVDRLIERFARPGGACESRMEIPGALAAIGNVEGLSVIERGLRDDCKEVRVASLRALGNAGPSARGGVGALMAFLHDSDPELTKEALAAIGELGPIAALAQPATTALFEDERASPALRARAAEALGRMGEAARGSAQALARALTAEDQSLRRSAADALQRMRGAACASSATVADLSRKATQGSPGDALHVLRYNPYLAGCVSAEIASMLDGPDPWLRQKAVGILSEAGERAQPAVPALARLLGRGTDPTMPILSALGSMGPASLAASPQLAARLEDRSPEVRQATAEAIDRMGALDARLSRGLLRLARAIGEPDEIRTRAIWVLANRRVPEARPLLEALLNDPNRGVVCAAAGGLGYYGPAARSALGRLDAILRDARLCYGEGIREAIDAIRE